MILRETRRGAITGGFAPGIPRLIAANFTPFQKISNVEGLRQTHCFKHKPLGDWLHDVGHYEKQTHSHQNQPHGVGQRNYFG
jgi:hypothetical protein